MLHRPITYASGREATKAPVRNEVSEPKETSMRPDPLKGTTNLGTKARSLDRKRRSNSKTCGRSACACKYSNVSNSSHYLISALIASYELAT